MDTEKGYTWVTPTEASKLLGISRKTVYKHISQGKLKSKTEGKKTLVCVTGKDTGLQSYDSIISEIEALRLQVTGLQSQVTHLTESLGIAMTILSVNVKAIQRGI